MKDFDLILYTAIVKSQGISYDEMKTDLKRYYREQNIPIPFEWLESMFDYYWSHTIVPVNKEKLK